MQVLDVEDSNPQPGNSPGGNPGNVPGGNPGNSPGNNPGPRNLPGGIPQSGNVPANNPGNVPRNHPLTSPRRTDPVNPNDPGALKIEIRIRQSHSYSETITIKAENFPQYN